MILQKHFKTLRLVPLFSEISDEDLEAMLSCLGAHVKTYSKESIILHAGDKIDSIGIVLEGSVQVIKEDMNGNRNIIGRFGKAEIFGETVACAEIEKSPVTVVTDSGTQVMFIGFKRIVTSCSSACRFHAKLIENMLKLITYKNLSLSEKIDCISHRSLRGKIESFLELQMEKAGKNPFEIHFSRAQMADYLCVDRSAMSAVLSKMRDDGYLKFDKNRFEILNPF